MKYILFLPVVSLVLIFTFLWYFIVRIFDTIRLKDIGDQLYKVEKILDTKPKYMGGLAVFISGLFWSILILTIIYYILCK